MPFGWAWLPRDGHVVGRPAAIQVAAQPALPTELRLVSGPVRFVRLPTPHYFCPHAELSYGVTTVKADEIDIYPDGGASMRPGTGFARGHVELTDPVGTIAADDATFNWIDRTGSASNTRIEFEGLRIYASKVSVQPGFWSLESVRAGLNSNRPLGTLLAAHATVRPGQGLAAFSVDARLFGTRIVGWRTLHFGLASRFGGDKYPVPTLSGQRGIGIRYRPMVLLDERTAVAAQGSVTQTELPSYGLELARSFLAAGEVHGLVLPRSELDMRFDFGYFDSTGVVSPSDEREQIGHPRDNLSVRTAWNVQAFDRKGSEVFAKPIEGTFERAFSGHDFSVLTDTTLQRIHVLGGSDHTRFINATTVYLPTLRIRPKVTGHLRLAGATFQGASTSFSWANAQFGLIYRPVDTWRMGVAYVAGKQFGTPLFLVDQLYSINSVDVRTDFQLGPRRLSLLGKFDTDRHRWYDREVAVSQQIGPVDVFARFRTFPSQLVFGAELRLDSVLNQLTSRSPKRPPIVRKLED